MANPNSLMNRSKSLAAKKASIYTAGNSKKPVATKLQQTKKPQIDFDFLI